MFPTVIARLENRSFTSGYPGNGLPETRLTVGLTLSTGAGPVVYTVITDAVGTWAVDTGRAVPVSGALLPGGFEVFLQLAPWILCRAMAY